jgi:hypothetical protein
MLKLSISNYYCLNTRIRFKISEFLTMIRKLILEKNVGSIIHNIKIYFSNREKFILYSSVLVSNIGVKKLE